MMEKKVDEDWKSQVERERANPKEQGKGAPGPASKRHAGPAPQEAQTTEFTLFLSSLSMQAMAALGEMPHPATHQIHEDLEQARYLIDTLGMLQEKTKGNLTAEEASLLEGLLYELRMKYVSKAKGK